MEPQQLYALAAGVLVPPGYSVGDDYEFFGYTSQQPAQPAPSRSTTPSAA